MDSMTLGKLRSVSARWMPVSMPLMTMPPRSVATLPSIVPIALPLSTSMKERFMVPVAFVPRPPMALFTPPVNLDMSGMMVM